jgi:DNA repair photolyase
LELSAGLDFETKIFVKADAPELLRKQLGSPNWEPQVVSISGVTDAYQPIERRLQITRRCLEVFAEFRNPVGIVTKSALVERDIDLLSELASVNAAVVILSITSLDPDLARVLEPRASAPAARLRAIETLAKAGIPTGVLTAPVILGLTDHEVPAILKAAADAGACGAGYTILRLPGAVAELFQTWLEQYYPDRKSKVLGRIRELRGGKLNDSRFGKRMTGEGPWAELFRKLYRTARMKAGIPDRFPEVSAKSFRNPKVTRSLFD